MYTRASVRTHTHMLGRHVAYTSSLSLSSASPLIEWTDSREVRGLKEPLRKEVVDKIQRKSDLSTSERHLLQEPLHLSKLQQSYLPHSVWDLALS